MGSCLSLLCNALWNQVQIAFILLKKPRITPIFDLNT